ncbi:MAG: hypothetical protein CMJ89_07165 [Planctomycetes bacterium]|nr:hypothetical protein [Planctomycetota bacterium]
MPISGHLWIRAPNWVGDLVMSTPILREASSCGRFEKVSIGVRSHLTEILADGPLEPHLVPIASNREEIARISEVRPDVALLLSNSPGAAWRALRARVPVRAGASLGGRRWLLTHRVTPPSRDGRRLPYPTRELMARIAALVGIEAGASPLHLDVGDETCEAAHRELSALGLEEGEPYCMSAPSAAFGAAKAWPPAHHAAVLDALYERLGWRGVLCGAPGEEPVLAAVAAAARHPVIDLSPCERTLSRLKAWVRGARLVLSSDSGPRWVAGAFGVPCVCLIGPNYPELTPPLPGSAVLRVEDLECSPCIRHSCPLGHHRCMEELPPERAIAAALDLVSP